MSGTSVPDDALAAINSEMENYFSKPLFDNSLQYANYIMVDPLNAVSGDKDGGNSLISFILHRTLTTECYDLSSLMLQLKIKVLDNDGKTPSPDYDVSVINAPFHSIFERFTITLNDKVKPVVLVH